MSKKIIFILCLFITYSSQGQTTYRINIDQPDKEIIRGHLDLGGSNPSGEEISVNNFYIEKGGKPFFPIVGEFHYSRFPEAYWEEEILKMKSGGINVVASYVFWNLHERQQGQYDWTGDLNLRKFIQLIHKHNLYAIVRIGPFCHGEIRNGGIPDWLYGQPFEVRSNDPDYLAYVDTFYGQIADQIKGMLYKDGGPVIGIQLENEYQHAHSPWEFTYPGSKKEKTVPDREAALTHEQITVTDGKNPWSEYGKRHMATLKAMAKDHGMDVPLYTATGWGNATIVEKGSIPVTAGYVYPFWSKPHPSNFYLFKDIKNNPDYSPVSYDTELYPSIPAEIGPGIQVKYSRRPVVDFKSVNPLMVRIIGSGSNGIGYYMYHGGSTPQFNGKFYNEEFNGLPRVNYDFQAPIGQYGQVRYHYKHLRMLHMFLEDYGEMLAPMSSFLPKTNEGITPEDTETLRYAIRSNGNSGFLFMINFQDHLDMKDIEQVSVKVETGTETISFPARGSFNVPKGTSAIFPFNLDLKEVIIKSATVQPLTTLHREESGYYIFSTVKGIEPEIHFSKNTKVSKLQNASVKRNGSLKTVKAISAGPFSFSANGQNFLVITQDMAMNSVKINEKLYISPALVMENSGSVQLISRYTENTLHIFPTERTDIPEISTNIKKEKSIFDGFGSYSITFEVLEPAVKFNKVSSRKYQLEWKVEMEKVNDVFLEVDYTGDRGLAFINGKLINDHFYQGKKWEIGLKTFSAELINNPMILVFHPMYPDYNYLGDLEITPNFEGGSLLEVKGIKLITEYKISW